MKKRSIRNLLAAFLLALLVGVSYAHAEETKGPQLATAPEMKVSPWQEAAKLYREKHYSKAASLYQSLLKKYPKNPALYFNLGNAYFKTGDYGRAVYSYEMAFWLDPRSKDIRKNLTFTRAQLKVSSGEMVPPYLKRPADYFYYIRLQEAVLLLLLVYCVFLVLTILRYKNPRSVFAFLRGVSFFVLLFAAAIFGFKYYLSHGQKAIVLEPQAEARYGPSNEEKAAFQLAEGAKVKVVDQSALWYRIQLEGDRTGWVEGKNLGLIREASS